MGKHSPLGGAASFASAATDKNFSKARLYDEYWRKEKSLVDTADALGVSFRELKQELSDSGIPIRGRPDSAMSWCFRHHPRERLFSDYWRENMTLQGMAEKYGVSTQTVNKRLEEFGIHKRPKGHSVGKHPQSKNYAGLSWNKGYRIWTSRDPDGQQRQMLVHRLAAVAEYGIESVKGAAVHHRNGIRWLNTPRFETDIAELKNPNLKPMDVVSHSRSLGPDVEG